jgi:hypothetical protein
MRGFMQGLVSEAQLNDISKLNLPDGCTRPYRPKPADFRATYISMGWDGLEDHYRTNWRVIRRWIEEEGRDELRAARAEHVQQIYAERRNRKRRYVLGRTLSAVNGGK